MDEPVHLVGEGVEPFLLREAVIIVACWKGEAILDTLQDGGDTHFDELVQVGRGNGEELDALQQRIGIVGGLVQDAAVESQPALVAVEEVMLRPMRF